MHFLNYAFLEAHHRNKTYLIVDCTLTLPFIVLMKMVFLFFASVCTLSILLSSSLVAGIMEDRRRVRFDPIYDHSYSEVSRKTENNWGEMDFYKHSEKIVYLCTHRYWTAE